MGQPKRIYIAGHQGMVGSAIRRQLEKIGDVECVLKSRAQLDLRDQSAVSGFFAGQPIDQVYIAAARVGGIQANSNHPAEFLYENLVIELNIIHAAWQAGVQRLLFLGSSCIYPRLANQPMAESELLTGSLEPTNEPYAVAKIAGIKLCESYNRQYGVDFRSIMPTNLYGPDDNFDLESSHVLPALLRKFHQAAIDGSAVVQVWGSGRPRREFLHVDDLATACEFVMNLDASQYWSVAQPRCSHINAGTGVDVTIRELAEKIAGLTGFTGVIEFDDSKPDGTPRKLLDTTGMSKLGWQAAISLDSGLADTYKWLQQHWDEITGQRG